MVCIATGEGNNKYETQETQDLGILNLVFTQTIKKNHKVLVV